VRFERSRSARFVGEIVAAETDIEYRVFQNWACCRARGVAIRALGSQSRAWADEGLLVFDGTGIERALTITRPEQLTFHPTRPLALIQGGCYSLRVPLYVVNTRTHSIVEVEAHSG